MAFHTYFGIDPPDGIRQLPAKIRPLDPGKEIVAGGIAKEERFVVLNINKGGIIRMRRVCRNNLNNAATKVKNNLSGYLYKTTRRSPMILPVISEI